MKLYSLWFWFLSSISIIACGSSAPSAPLSHYEQKTYHLYSLRPLAAAIARPQLIINNDASPVVLVDVPLDDERLKMVYKDIVSDDKNTKDDNDPKSKCCSGCCIQ